MKKRILLIISIVVLAVVLSTMLFACSTETTLTGDAYDEQVSYYADIVEDVKKCESTLDSLMTNLKGSSFCSTFIYERYYFSTSIDNRVFKGSQTDKGYEGTSDESATWMVESIQYVIKYKDGDYSITAKVYEDVKEDDYKEGTGTVAATYAYRYTVANGEEYSGGDGSVVKAYCVDNIINVIFGQYTSDEFLENYATSASKGFRLYTSMMQYQTVRAFPYAADGTIDTSTVINYTQNKEKILFSALSESFDGNDLVYTLNNEVKDPAGDDIAYWDSYGEDISYNFFKTAAVYNDRITMTYSSSKSRVDSFEYYGEIVLPFYTKKNKFQTYNVLKYVVADYTHFTIEMDYESSFEV